MMKLQGERRIVWRRSEVKRSKNDAKTETEFISDQQQSRSTARSTGVHKCAHGSSVNRRQAYLGANLPLLLGFELHFWIRDESNWGFLNFLVSLAINKRAEPSWIVCKVQIVLVVESIKSLSCPEDVGKLPNLVKYCVCFLSCFFVLDF